MEPYNEKPNKPVSGLLAQKYLKDYQSSVSELPDTFKFELLSHLLDCLDLVKNYLLHESEENWKLYADKERELSKKHLDQLKVYKQKNFLLYYGDSRVLVEKEIYSTEEWNSLNPERQVLSREELFLFIELSKNMLNNYRDFELLRQHKEDIEPENQKQGLHSNDENYIIPRRSKIKREAKDKLTCLSQEQTVLLLYYLQQERVFLKDEYLSDLEAARAFEILTGYSNNALRQNLGKYNLWLNPPNLIELDNLLTRLKAVINLELKRK